LSLSFILTVTILTLVIAIIYKIIKANLGKSFDSQRTLNSLNKENKKKAKQLVLEEESLLKSQIYCMISFLIKAAYYSLIKDK
jgi:uncharacterized membrane protein